MSLDPAARYPSAQHLAQDVEHFLADEPTSAFREPLFLKVHRFARRHRAWTQAAAAALAAITLVAVLGAVLISAARSREQQAFQREQAQRAARPKGSITAPVSACDRFVMKANRFARCPEDLRSPKRILALPGLKLAKILAAAGPETELADLTSAARIVCLSP